MLEAERAFIGRRLTQVLQKRTKDGSLLSVRVPVTPGNRRVLRVLRAAELAAWHALEPNSHRH